MNLSILLSTPPEQPHLTTLCGLLEADGFSCNVAEYANGLPTPPPDAAVLFDNGSDAARAQVTHLKAAGVPTFAVAIESSRERFGCLMNAGANGVLPPGVSDERIAAEIEALSELRRQATGGGANYALQPFLAATIEAWALIAGCKARLTKVQVKNEFSMPGDMTATISLFGPIDRVLALSLSLQDARALGQRVLASTGSDPDDSMVADTVCEMINVVAGQVKGRFEGTPFDFEIGTPELIIGSPHQLMHRPELPCHEMEFTSDIGVFYVQLGAQVPEGLK